MNEVAVTVLPHPITTFILGALIFSMAFIFMEFKRLVAETKTFNVLLKKLEEHCDKMEISFDKKLDEVSRKVDSRVDKAISVARRKIDK